MDAPVVSRPSSATLLDDAVDALSDAEQLLADAEDADRLAEAHRSRARTRRRRAAASVVAASQALARVRMRLLRRGPEAAVIATLTILAPTALAATPGATIARIAPGGNITSVVRAVDAHGWPHAPTRAETRDVTDLVLAHQVGRKAGQVTCFFGTTMGRPYCGVVIWPRSQPPTPAKPRRYRVDLRIWEDGSYAFTNRPGR